MKTPVSGIEYPQGAETGAMAQAEISRKAYQDGGLSGRTNAPITTWISKPTAKAVERDAYLM
jgi:hypothetical protein